MEPRRDLAITLRSVPFEERHRIVTALTENHGRISAMARNSIQSRRFGGALEPFAAAEWTFVGKPGADLYRVDQATIRRSFEGLRKDFERLSLASLLNEVMLKVAPEREPCADLFKLHANALAAIEEGHGSIGLLNAYLGKVLQWSGNQPPIGACLECGITASAIASGAQLRAHIADAGWTCPACRPTQRSGQSALGTANVHQLSLSLSPLAILDLELSLHQPIKGISAHLQASTEEHKKLFSFLEALFAFHVPGFDRMPMKSLRFLGLESLLTSQPYG